jgi:hypothetical protein
MNKDYCIAGIARASFAAKKYLDSDLQYLDIPKSSFVWPEILFEEAWNSYYLKNYNRTLGKLVSYKAPVFDFIFNPEIEVLKAQSYMKMCLYDDVKKTVDEFYAQLMNPAKELRSKVISSGKSYEIYLKLIEDYEHQGFHSNPLLSVILRTIKKDPNYIELREDLNSAMSELQNARNEQNSSLRTLKIKNVKEVVSTYLNLIGGLVRGKLVSKYAEVYRAFQTMSYLKLEVLSLRKQKLYSTDKVETKKRGDVEYIEKNDKQYFWTFNTEFWADELGDYVFALRSEC